MVSPLQFLWYSHFQWVCHNKSINLLDCVRAMKINVFFLWWHIPQQHWSFKIPIDIKNNIYSILWFELLHRERLVSIDLIKILTNWTQNSKQTFLNTMQYMYKFIIHSTRIILAKLKRCHVALQDLCELFVLLRKRMYTILEKHKIYY